MPGSSVPGLAAFRSATAAAPCAIAWMADGSIVPTDTIVRFDVAEGEKAPRRLADALQQTNARAIRFFGGDDVVRSAIRGLELDVKLDGAAFMFRHGPALTAQRDLPRARDARHPSRRRARPRTSGGVRPPPRSRSPRSTTRRSGSGSPTRSTSTGSSCASPCSPPFRGRGFGAAIAGHARRSARGQRRPADLRRDAPDGRARPASRSSAPDSGWSTTTSSPNARWCGSGAPSNCARSRGRGGARRTSTCRWRLRPDRRPTKTSRRSMKVRDHPDQERAARDHPHQDHRVDADRAAAHRVGRERLDDDVRRPDEHSASRARRKARSRAPVRADVASARAS